MQWVNACLGKDQASANFDFAGPLTETVLLGVLAARFPGQKLAWDAAKFQVTNLPEANRSSATAIAKDGRSRACRMPFQPFTGCNLGTVPIEPHQTVAPGHLTCSPGIVPL